MESFQLKSQSRSDMIEVTERVEGIVRKSGVHSGVCVVFVPHTTAGVTINEDADPSVQEDIKGELDKVIPLDDDYAHSEGNSAAHIKMSLVGPSVTIPVEEGKLALGTWQGIFLCEFDGPRTRHCHVQVVGR